MTTSQSSSFLAVLSLYVSLRRSGSTEAEAQNKVRGLVGKLSAADHQALVRASQEWETQQGKKVDQARTENDIRRGGMVISPQAASIYGTSEYDSVSSTNTATALQPVHSVVTCPNCLGKNEGGQTRCAYCGKPLQSIRVTSALNEVDPTWCGPTSKLVLTAQGEATPLEIALRPVMTLGRHTPDEAKADIDLRRYQADDLGVSRLHACLQWQHYRLTVVDLDSKFHTFVNGKQLREGEIVMLTSGDTIRLGALDLSVTFRHEK